MTEPSDFILAGGRAYPASVFHAALNTAMLARLEATLPEGSSPRRAFRAVRDLKTHQAHAAVMNHTLRLLAESGEDVPLAQAIREAKAIPIAAFPIRIDNPNKTG